MKILLVDNYDSFTYNLVDRLSWVSGGEISVVLNDDVDPESALAYDRIIISPGPGIPSEAGRTIELLRTITGKLPVLGVCLGHQAIAEVFGGGLVNLDEVFHGVSSPLKYIDPADQVMQGIYPGDEVGRYHSWVVDPGNIPSCFTITATDENDMIMAMKHEQLPVYSVQFHPESVLTPKGDILLKNWLSA